MTHTQKETDQAVKERMPPGLPGEGAEKAEGGDKATVAENCQSIAMEMVVFLYVR